MNTIRTNHGDFIRDVNSSSLINTNVDSFKAYKKQRENRSQIESQAAVINNLTNEVAELKELVKRLIEEKNG